MTPEQDPDKATKTTIHDLIGKDTVASMFEKVSAANPKYLAVIWTEGENDTLRWRTNAMTDALFVYLLEATKFEFLNQGTGEEQHDA